MAKYQPSNRTLAVSRVYQHGKTQVPSDVRGILGLQDGDKIVWKLDNEKVVVEVAQKRGAGA